MTTHRASEARMLAWLAEQGQHGATDEQMQEALALIKGTQQLRRRLLEEAGLIEARGLRFNRNRRLVKVWVAKTRA